MEQTTRRGALATMGLVATAGCSQLSLDDSNGDPDDADQSSGSNSPLRERSVADVSRTVTIEPDDFESVELSFDQQTVLLLSVVADRPVDVLTFSRSSFEKYRDETVDQVPYVDALSEEGTAATAQGSAVSAGEPVVVVDNSSWGTAPPEGPAQVELEVEAFVRAADGTKSSPSTSGDGNASQ